MVVGLVSNKWPARGADVFGRARAGLLHGYPPGEYVLVSLDLSRLWARTSWEGRATRAVHIERVKKRQCLAGVRYLVFVRFERRR